MQYSPKPGRIVEENCTVHIRDLWDWVTAQVSDPKLAPYFQWDAQKLCRWNGERWVEFWDEPCSGAMMWDAQVMFKL